MEPESIDTSPEAERVLLELIRRSPVSKRLALVSDLIDATRAFALADIRRHHPGASEAELRRLLASRVLTPEEVRAVCGPERGRGAD